ncbi:MAG TPA: phosphate acyltransferase PlsX [Chloroflexota bacterium]
MRLALDAMGGDFAPAVAVEGAVAAARELDVEVALVGPEQTIRAELARHQTSGLTLPVVDAEEVVTMEEHAASTIRQKPNSSIAVGVRLVKSGDAAGFVSAGHSGAVMAAALFGLGRIQGVERPAIGTVFPTTTGRCFVIDVGANADCKPEYLLQFAVMGSLFAERIMGIDRPRVGILSNGEEETKGNALVLATHPLLRASRLNFVGNVEGKDVPQGLADVVVTDGFSGNILIKLGEGVGSTLFDLIRAELSAKLRYKLAALVLKPAFRRVAKKLDYAEYGGANLLGVNGPVVIAHGRSNARAIKNALRVAKQSVEQKLVDAIKSGIAAEQGAV